MKKTFVLLAGLAGLLSWSHASAAPMSPNDRDISGAFSATVKDAFVLLADTDDVNLVYYVPKRGAVAVQSPLSASPIPRFQIFSRYPTYGFFAGEELAFIGGTLSTTGDLGMLGQLQAEAAQKGYRVTPSPATTATAVFVATGYQATDGTIDVSCTFEELQVNTKTVRVPKCFLRSAPNQPYDLDTNIMYKFTSLAARNSSVVSQDIPFQAVTLPGWTEPLRALMSVGGQWDNVLTAQVVWNIQASSLTRQARFNIDWDVLFQQASAYAGARHWFLYDVDVKAFFQQFRECTDEKKCGVRPEYRQADGTWTDQAPNDADFVTVSEQLRLQLETELFNRIAAAKTSQLGMVSTRHSAMFTLRANYERIITSGHEVRYIAWNPGVKPVEAATTLNISCLEGGFEQGKVTWSMTDPGCRALLGQP